MQGYPSIRDDGPAQRRPRPRPNLSAPYTGSAEAYGRYGQAGNWMQPNAQGATGEPRGQREGPVPTQERRSLSEAIARGGQAVPPTQAYAYGGAAPAPAPDLLPGRAAPASQRPAYVQTAEPQRQYQPVENSVPGHWHERHHEAPPSHALPNAYSVATPPMHAAPVRYNDGAGQFSAQAPQWAPPQYVVQPAQYDVQQQQQQQQQPAWQHAPAELPGSRHPAPYVAAGGPGVPAAQPLYNGERYDVQAWSVNGH